MMMRIKKKYLRSPLLPLLLFALAWRALIPVGYMPSSVNGRFAIVMCPGVMLSAGNSAHGPLAPHGATTPCPYAVSALPPLPLSVKAIVLPPLPVGEIVVPAGDSGHVLRSFRAQRARAPPLSRKIPS